MQSIKLNITKELRMPWQVRLHLHTCCSCMFVPCVSRFQRLCCALAIHWAENPRVVHTKCVKLVKDLLSRFVKNSFMNQANLLPKEEIIQAINQEEKCKVYHSYFYIPDTFFILYIHQYLLCFNFWKPVPKFLVPPFCSYNWN